MATAESDRNRYDRYSGAPQQGFIFPLALDLKSQEKQQKHPPIDISVLTPISCAGTGEQTGWQDGAFQSEWLWVSRGINVPANYAWD